MRLLLAATPYSNLSIITISNQNVKESEAFAARSKLLKLDLYYFQMYVFELITT